MNKQELIKEFREVGIYSLNIFGTEIKAIPTEIAITSIEQLDEPQPVKVPPPVAVWYEINKDNLDKNIAYLCLNNWGEFINDKTLFNWMSNTDNFIQILVNMHQFGYEIEKEKRYLVKMKGMSEENTYLTFRFGHTWMLSNFEECEEFRLHHTRKELEEAGFGWVFDCPGIEIEEVE